MPGFYTENKTDHYHFDIIQGWFTFMHDYRLRKLYFMSIEKDINQLRFRSEYQKATVNIIYT